MSGYTAVARHEAIIARMQRGSEHLLQLIAQGRDKEAQGRDKEAQGRDKEAQALMESDWWTQDERDRPAPPDA